MLKRVSGGVCRGVNAPLVTECLFSFAERRQNAEAAASGGEDGERKQQDSRGCNTWRVPDPENDPRDHHPLERLGHRPHYGATPDAAAAPAATTTPSPSSAPAARSSRNRRSVRDCCSAATTAATTDNHPRNRDSTDDNHQPPPSSPSFPSRCSSATFESEPHGCYGEYSKQ